MVNWRLWDGKRLSVDEEFTTKICHYNNGLVIELATLIADG